MFATIRSCARLIKAVKSVLSKTKAKACKTQKIIQLKTKEKISFLKNKFRSLISWFKPREHDEVRLVLIHQQLTNGNKPKVFKQQQEKSAKNDDDILPSSKPCLQANELPAHAIEEFYKEWEASWGPSLTSMDKEFLESASPELAIKVMGNGREMLKSPYLKAIYNGLKDLQDISDLLAYDKLAKEKLLPYLKDYYERKPEQFYEMLCAVHDKGVFKTRSGDRRLSLDPRLIPAWLGLEPAS